MCRPVLLEAGRTSSAGHADCNTVSDFGLDCIRIAQVLLQAAEPGEPLIAEGRAGRAQLSSNAQRHPASQALSMTPATFFDVCLGPYPMRRCILDCP